MMAGLTQKIHVLVVEDNIGDYLLIEEHLLEKFEQIKITHCSNYKHTLSCIEKASDISVVLLDLFLPDKSGTNLTQKIQALWPDAPIIVLTGYSDSRTARELLNLGVSDFLIKDEINPEILHKSIIYAIERNSFVRSLEQAKQDYEEIFEVNPQPMFVYDSKTLQIINANDAATMKYGYSKEEFLNMTIRELRPTDQIKFLEERLSLPIEQRTQKYAGVFIHKLKSGEEIKVEIYSSNIHYKDMEARLVVSNDITEKQNYLSTIEEQNKKLKKIAWTQSHIVRAPLSRILGIINYIESKPEDTSDLLFFLQQLRVSAEELDVIIKQIVDETVTLNIDLNAENKEHLDS